MATANDIKAALRKRLPSDAWALYFEVASGTGYASGRFADAIAMSLWPSRGLEVQGFEFKVSRADWTKELANPAKAEEIARYCDRWWIVVGDAKIVKDGELPPTWGLLTIDPKKPDQLRKVVAAPKLDPAPLDRPFLAALLRRAAAPIAAADGKAIRQAQMKGQTEGEERASRMYDRDRKSAEELRERVKAFEEASGITINYRWASGAKIGQAVRDVLDGKHERDADDLRRIRSIAQEIVERIPEGSEASA